jgi:hypothetical protein
MSRRYSAEVMCEALEILQTTGPALVAWVETQKQVAGALPLAHSSASKGRGGRIGCR